MEKYSTGSTFSFYITNTFPYGEDPRVWAKSFMIFKIGKLCVFQAYLLSYPYQTSWNSTHYGPFTPSVRVNTATTLDEASDIFLIENNGVTPAWSITSVTHSCRITERTLLVNSPSSVPDFGDICTNTMADCPTAKFKTSKTSENVVRYHFNARSIQFFPSTPFIWNEY